MSLNLSPPVHRGMTALDRAAFSKSIRLLGARVPAARSGPLLKADPIRKSVLREPRIKNVVGHELGESERIILFNVETEDELSADAREFLASEGATLVHHDLVLDYDYWSREQILESILPEELCGDAPSSFTITGHLAHYNLRDEYLPFKHLVGQVTLDKNPGLRTVVNKLDAIDTQFRFFKMELLAGEPEYVVEAHEASCKFKFDFSCVYWNSRLHGEHERLVSIFQPQDVVADAFAGVGPFAVPAAKLKQCLVYANDLNPKSVEWLKVNVKGNHVDSNVRVSELDGREFIRNVFASAWRSPIPAPPPYKSAKQKARERHYRNAAPQQQAGAAQEQQQAAATRDGRRIDHVVMNLPDSALTFLDAFQGALSIPGVDEADVRGLYTTMPTVHVHCFTRELEFEAAKTDLLTRAARALGAPLPGDALFHLVRSVAPNKEMYCVSFALPESVAFARK
ncbi:guanine-N(1)--methyltransferase [Auricularia subglabra TFB-10046 SS5]|nr:guanine-N(1)--methyltransferase [Auricularia subglabra TFB-10046 SS5]